MKNGWYKKSGDLKHYVNDKLHNEKYPAEIYNKGNKYWIQNGKDHRLDGPAWEYSHGYKCWWYHGEGIDCLSQEKFERLLKLKSLW